MAALVIELLVRITQVMVEVRVTTMAMDLVLGVNKENQGILSKTNYTQTTFLKPWQNLHYNRYKILM